MCPSRVTATMMASSRSALGIFSAFSALAMFTGRPFCNIGVITMKMISSTSMMSAIGMTFGAAITGGAFGLYPMKLLLSAATGDEIVDQLHRGVVHLDVEGFHAIGEIVVGPHGRNGDQQTESSGDQGFCDTAGHG